MKEIETTLLGFRSRGAELVLSFAVQHDDIVKVEHLAKMVGHAFELDIREIDYDNPQPNMEVQNSGEPKAIGTPARAAALKPNPYVVRAGIYCKNMKFIAWASRTFSCDKYETIEEIVRNYCGVESRADILPGSPAAKKFDELVAMYEAAGIHEANQTPGL